jgi:hypothetical protein
VLAPSPARSGPKLNRQNQPLITVWLEVRILPSPPRSHPLDEISRLLPNGAELAGSAIRVPVSAETNDRPRRVLAELSLAQESRFPETKRRPLMSAYVDPLPAEVQF